MIRRAIMIATVFLAAASLYATGAGAGQTEIRDYDTARDDFFWPQLYQDGGETIYCGIILAPGERVTVEHAFPADWIADAFGCPNRNNCPDPGYGFAEADLHNLWPALGGINSSRGKVPFAELPDDEGHHRFTASCPDYERSRGSNAVVEPRDVAKGNLARSILYMSATYDLPIKGDVLLLIRWHREDPPDAHERSRNDTIEQLQGTRNPYIDYPEVLNVVPTE